MKAMKYWFLVMLAVCFSGTAMAKQCAPRGELVRGLAGKFHETPVAIGTISGELIMEMFASTKGTWTILVTNNHGMSCIASAGENFELQALKAPGSES